ncbi:MAG: HAMP domain-containing sensor histidine kinase [Magnetospirillum sp.]|nr:HAMP domain-containing sensor histidine kinase [Magnetospirillum sp.]
MNRRSLTFRLVSWYCGLLMLLGAAFATYTYTNFDRYIRQTNRENLGARAEAVWDIARNALGDEAGLAQLIEQRFAPETQGRFIRISVGGRVVYVSPAPVEHDFDPATVPLSAASGKPRLDRWGNLLLYVRQFALPGGAKVTVETGVSNELMETAETGLATSLLIGLPVLLILATSGGYVLVRRALAPVEAMIEAAEALTFNSPHNRLPLAGTGDRVEALGSALNRMLERLDNAYQQASRFSADAAHELRTPLSIMRGELELMATRLDLPADVQTAVGNTLDEAVRLSQIVESLIALSRMDSIGGKRVHRAVDLIALAAETIDQMRLLAEEKDIRLDGPSRPPVFVAGDRDRLKQVLVNLIDNATKYTPSGGRVSVDVATVPGMAVLAVTDTGIGIAPQHQGMIFDRFFRVATARGEVGAGLGLAIVKSICTAHGGRVTVASSPGAGSTFRVELPLASADLIGKPDGIASAGNRDPVT